MASHYGRLASVPWGVAAGGEAVDHDVECLDNLLERGVVRTLYQPIVDLDTGLTVAHEALARGPAGSRLEQADRLFATAGRAGRVTELDIACRTAALAGARARGMRFPWTLFVNMEPETAGADVPLAAVRQDGLVPHADTPAHGLVMELTERALTSRPAELLAMVTRLRERGWGVALDDVGADPDSLALLPLLRPDVIKLDLSLVQDSPSAQVARIVSAVNAEAERSGSVVLAEGIETEEHLAVALSLGATLGQGWMLGRPAPLPVLGGPLPPTTLPFIRGHTAVDTRTPYELAAAVRTPRVSRKALLIELSKHLERRAQESGESTVVLSTFQEAHFFTPATMLRYTDLAARSSFVGVLGADMGASPAPGVRGASLPAGDPLLGEWDIAVVGPHFAALLVARDLGDSGPDRQRRFTFVLSHDRELAIASASKLMSRLVAEPPPGRRHAANDRLAELTA